MKIKQMSNNLRENHMQDNLRALARDLQAILDYNVMMGVIEDPMAYEDESEEANDDE